MVPNIGNNVKALFPDVLRCNNVQKLIFVFKINGLTV